MNAKVVDTKINPIGFREHCLEFNHKINPDVALDNLKLRTLNVLANVL